MSPTQRQFTNVHDFILKSLCLFHACRTWFLANIIMTELWQVKCTDESCGVKVVNHKTLATSGTACVVLTHDLFKESETFLFLMRLCLEGIDKSTIDQDH